MAAIWVLRKVVPSQMTMKYNITLKAPPIFVCMKNTTLMGVSRQIRHSASPRAVFFLHMHGIALTITFLVVKQIRWATLAGFSKNNGVVYAKFHNYQRFTYCTV